MLVTRTLTISLLLIVSVTAIAQDQYSGPPLSGFQYVLVHPPQYTDGTVDPDRLAPYLEDLLRKQGWLIHSGAEDLFAINARQLASQTIQCAIGFDDTGFGTTAIVRCSDALGLPLFTITGKGVAMSQSGELRAALRDVAKRLQAMRPRFDPDRTMDIVSRLPPVETLSVTEGVLDQMAEAGKLLHPVEGVWAATDESGYRLGIVSVDKGREFAVVMLHSPRSFLWQPGMIKARLTQAANQASFVATWRMADRRETPGVANLEGGTLTIRVNRNGTQETISLLKLRPTAAVRGGRNTDPSRQQAGTGFICGPGLIATNHHVIEGASAIQFFLPLQRRSFDLQLIVSDAANDLAILRVLGDVQRDLPDPLRLADSSGLRLGAEAVVVGFPLADLLGSGHKVTAGLVSALDGLLDDPRAIQLTAQIQSGSSGSPVFNNEGEVIAVVTSTFDTTAAVRLSGQAPQNLNFAVKSDYLALLLKRVPGTILSKPRGQSKPLLMPDMVKLVSQAVGQIHASR